MPRPFSTLAAAGALTLTLAASAQPAGTPSPHAPAAASQPGAVELSKTLADDPEARKLLTECAGAVTRMGPTAFKIHYATDKAAMVIDGHAEVRFVRNTAVPNDSTFFGKGRLQMPALDKPDFFVSRYKDDAGKLRVAYQDDAAKAVIDRPEGPGPDGKETDGNRQMGLVLRSMLPPSLISPTPFSDELKVSTAGNDSIKTPCVFMPDEKIGDETCKVVRVIFKEGAAERKVWIGSDKLPRRYEQFRNGLSRYWEITDLKKLAGPEAADADKLKVPEGYRLDKQDIGGIKPAAPASADPQIPAQVTPAPGPAIGQIAPDFDLKTADGAGVSLNSLKGQTLIVTFGGSMFPQSWPAQSRLAQAVAGRPVKLVSIACRESAPDRAAKAFADAHAQGPLLLGGDETARLYNARGFPSTVVIGADGKVKAFYEGQVNAAELGAVLDAAGAGK